MTVFSEQLELFEEDEEYKAFVGKFKPKKTTDDCLTPDNVYAVVRDWACARYGIDPSRIVRPFYPNGDFERYDYPEGCFVLDNPPFSIMSRILDFYLRNNVRFFLFAHGLTLLGALWRRGLCAVCCGASIEYENGAQIATGFLTTEGADEYKAITAPDLYRTIKTANEENRKARTKELRKLSMPIEVATTARLNWLSVHGEDYRIEKGQAEFLSALDCGCDLFGGGLLLSERAAAERAAAERAAAERAAAERAAAERAAAERAAAERIELSPREKSIQAMIGWD